MKKGISLVALVITIIVLIILTGAVILTATNTNIFGKSEEAVFKNNVASFQEELTKKIMEKKLEDPTFSEATINATTSADIAQWIPSIVGTGYEESFEIVGGKLVFTGEDTKQIEYVEKLGITASASGGNSSSDNSSAASEQASSGDNNQSGGITFTSGTIPAFTLNTTVPDRDRSNVVIYFKEKGEEYTKEHIHFITADDRKAIEITCYGEMGILTVAYTDRENSGNDVLYVYAFDGNSIGLENEGWYICDQETGEFDPLASSNFPTFSNFVINENTWGSADYVEGNLSVMNTYVGDVFSYAN